MASTRILLVEDNLDHAQLALRALRDLGTCDVVRRGAEGLAKAREAPYDLVVTDYRLPDMSGADVARGVRAVSDCPILVMTSEGREEVAAEALAVPGVAFLAKDGQLARRLAYEARALLGGRA
ncbi:MAG TPA: response regulator [Candidatus Thermoplasmatota archaeon]|nr:response regulator [Candidatus Thermoplasmatota archaeon]